MIISDITDFRVQYDAELRLLRTDWGGSRHTQQLRPGLTQIQQLAKRLGVTHVLVETNGLPDLSVYDQLWLGTSWMPTVFQLPLRCAVVVFNPARVYNGHAIETILMMARPFIKFDLQFFHQAGPGLQWLLSNSPRAAELLAEWEAAYGGTLPPTSYWAEPRAEYRPLPPTCQPGS